MAETANELLLVQSIRRHLHAPHGVHGLVHPEELILSDFDIERRCVGVVRMERVFVQLDAEWARVRSVVRELGGIGRRLECTNSETLERYEKNKDGSVSLVGQFLGVDCRAETGRCGTRVFFGTR